MTLGNLQRRPKVTVLRASGCELVRRPEKSAQAGRPTSPRDATQVSLELFGALNYSAPATPYSIPNLLHRQLQEPSARRNLGAISSLSFEQDCSIMATT